MCSRDFELSRGPRSTTQSSQTLFAAARRCVHGGKQQRLFPLLRVSLREIFRNSAAPTRVWLRFVRLEKANSAGARLKIRRCPMGAWGDARRNWRAFPPRNKHVRPRSRHLNAKKCECAKSSGRGVRREKTPHPQHLGSWRRLDHTLDICGVRCWAWCKRRHEKVLHLLGRCARYHKQTAGAWACRIALSGD